MQFEEDDLFRPVRRTGLGTYRERWGPGTSTGPKPLIQALPFVHRAVSRKVSAVLEQWACNGGHNQHWRRTSV